MPLYVADYLRDTRRLRPADHGAYLLLIMEYWTAGSLPEDDAQLARIVGMTPAEWKKAKPVVQPFFYDGWCHRRIDEEMLKAEAKHMRRSEAGKRGNEAKANAKQSARNADRNASDNAVASSSQPERIDAASAAPDPERELFERGRQVLGKQAGGLVAKLLTAKQKNIALARAAIEQASTKSDPREYVGRIINGQKPGDIAWLGGIEGVV